METKKRVLIAEDDTDLRTIFAKIFSRREFEVQLAVDGQQAITALEQMLPDILILDVNMPYISGLDVLTYIRASEHLKHLKVIVVTGNATAYQSPESNLADLFLIKQVSTHDLVVLAQRLIDDIES